MIELYQKYRVKPAFAKGEGGVEQSLEGRVVYIHPKGRYAVLEFKGPQGKARESFELSELTECNRVREKKGRNA